VAMTASAMLGDREHCITSGMDDYLSKPVSLEQLQVVLDRWLPRALVEPPAQAPPPEAAAQARGDSAIDVDRLVEMYGAESIKEILDLFVRETNHLLGEVDHAVRRQDSRGLATVAHQLKGLCAVMSAGEMEKLSLDLEKAASGRSWDSASCTYRELQSAFGQVSSCIDTIVH